MLEMVGSDCVIAKYSSGSRLSHTRTIWLREMDPFATARALGTGMPMLRRGRQFSPVRWRRYQRLPRAVRAPAGKEFRVNQLGKQL